MRIIRQVTQGLRFTMAVPPPHLRGVVESFFELHGTPGYRVHRMLPRPGQQLHINLGEPLGGLSGATGAAVNFQRHLLTGSRTAWFDSRPTGHVHFMGITFTPTGLHSLLRIPQHELSDRDLALDDVLPTSDVERWREQLGSATESEERLRLLCSQVERFWSATGHGASDNALLVVAYALEHPHLPVKALGSRTGFSRQYLLRLMRERTGLSLQEHQRLVRMNAALRSLATPGTAITEAALSAGFYDQAHFSRHFKRFAGLTPAAYVRAERGAHPDPYFA